MLWSAHDARQDGTLTAALAALHAAYPGTKVGAINDRALSARAQNSQAQNSRRQLLEAAACAGLRVMCAPGEDASAALRLMTSKLSSSARSCVIITQDLSLVDLIRPGVQLLLPVAAGGWRYWGEEEAQAALGLSRSQWPLYSRLRTAEKLNEVARQRLAADHGTWDALLLAAQENSPSGRRAARAAQQISAAEQKRKTTAAAETLEERRAPEPEAATPGIPEAGPAKPERPSRKKTTGHAAETELRAR